MKKQFDNAGVLALQQELLTMDAAEFQAVLHLIRTDFKNFMMDHFLLSAEQEMDVFNLDGDILSELSTGVANTLENNLMVAFQKDIRQAGEDFKDIIISPPGPHPPKHTFAAGPVALSIYIRYRSE